MQTQHTSYIVMDKLRKQCLAALCAYIDTKEIKHNNKIEYAKKMACIAAKVEDFNKIIPAQLRGITAYFNKERKAYNNSQKLTEQTNTTANVMTYIPFAEA